MKPFDKPKLVMCDDDGDDANIVYTTKPVRPHICVACGRKTEMPAKLCARIHCEPARGEM